MNFDNIESAKSEPKESSFKIVKPGVQPLMISAVEGIISSKKSSPGLTVTFESQEAGASFTENFWLSEGALPRLQYLMEKFTGAKMTGEIGGEGLELAQNVAASIGPKLIGKSKSVVVDGERTSKEKDGTIYQNIYPILRFAGFVEPEGDAANPIIKDKTMSQSAQPAMGIADDSADLPF